MTATNEDALGDWAAKAEALRVVRRGKHKKYMGGGLIAWRDWFGLIPGKAWAEKNKNQGLSLQSLEAWWCFSVTTLQGSGLGVGGCGKRSPGGLPSAESFYTPLIFLLRKLARNGEVTG